MKNYFVMALLILVVKPTQAQNQKKNDEVFFVKPYLQIGKAPSPQVLQLLWQSPDTTSVWAVEYKIDKKSAWKKAEFEKTKKMNIQGIAPRSLFNAHFKDLLPGSVFTYRVHRNKQEVFTAEAKSLKAENQAFRFIAFGDIGAGTPEQKSIVTFAQTLQPDLVLVPGDIVYEHGTASEYDARFWPVYNADKADGNGVPMIRSTPFIVSTGNHDTDLRDLDQFPDGLAYYYYWDLPLNGPPTKEGSAYFPTLKATDANRKAFMDLAVENFPRMTNYSMDYGNAHWVFLDSNPYVDCTGKELQEWLAKDLAAASGAQWRFVVFHHPGFNSAREHYEQQQMRLLSPIFEAGKVDVVFNGHVHNYQRSFPMKFTPDKQGSVIVGGKDGKTVRGRVVNGRWILDKTFDGEKDTSPEGIIYVITGAGGQTLYNPEQNNDPDSWQKFTDKFISNVHSLTLAEVEGNKLVVKQLGADGKELDHFTIVKELVKAAVQK
jgi:hypothetical protein